MHLTHRPLKLLLLALALVSLSLNDAHAAEAPVVLKSNASDDSRRVNATSTVRVAGIVLKWVRADKEANFRRVEPMIREAATNGARIVCTTECFLEGTGRDGGILSQTVLEDRLLITPEQMGGPHDRNRVFYFDLPTIRRSVDQTGK